MTLGTTNIKKTKTLLIFLEIWIGVIKFSLKYYDNFNCEYFLSHKNVLRWKCNSSKSLIFLNSMTMVGKFSPSRIHSIPVLTYLINYSMEQIHSWEANSFSDSQEIPRTLRKPKVHYRIHKCPHTCPYPEPDRSSPYTHIRLLKAPS
jgi:hypothetical protein